MVTWNEEQLNYLGNLEIKKITQVENIIEILLIDGTLISAEIYHIMTLDEQKRDLEENIRILRDKARVKEIQLRELNEQEWESPEMVTEVLVSLRTSTEIQEL